ncbi:hypothetical protein KM043_002163 [Ampulex compressa]|nr:hypothetical protein KM043_002163 [Ampulex compressa]
MGLRAAPARCVDERETDSTRRFQLGIVDNTLRMRADWHSFIGMGLSDGTNDGIIPGKQLPCSKHARAVNLAEITANFHVISVPGTGDPDFGWKLINLKLPGPARFEAAAGAGDLPTGDGTPGQPVNSPREMFILKTIEV